MTLNLSEFLRARLDEDDLIARAACWDEQSDVWTARPPRARYERYTVVDYLDDGVVVVTPENADPDGVGQHIARHDPARILAEVGAKRKLVAAYESAVTAYGAAERGTTVSDLMTGSVNSLRFALQLLALSYADRPGFKEEWRP
jgi:hypothetical protein